MKDPIDSPEWDKEPATFTWLEKLVLTLALAAALFGLYSLVWL